jgi:DNA-binding beta-propeller fold protein YncE
MKRFSVRLLCFAALGACAQTPATLKPIETIPLAGVQGRFDHFALDAKGRQLFVAALGNNTLEVLDLAGSKRIQSLSGFSKPQGVLYLPAKNRVLVANGDSGTLSVLDGASFKVLQTLGEMADADNVRYDAAGDFVYVGYGDGALGVVRAATAEKVATIKLAGHPESFQLEKNGSRIFVNVPDAKQVAVVDREKRAVAVTWPMDEFQANFPMALDEAHQRLFIGCRKPPRLLVLDTATGKPTANLAIDSDTDDLFYDAARRRLYLSCGAGYLDVVDRGDADTYHMRERLATRPGARTSFLSTDLNQLYLAVPRQGTQTAEIRVLQLLP